jgi:glycosyltransferase involved in cell wall biosynthesis
LQREVLFSALKSFVKARPHLRAFLLLLYAGLIGVRDIVRGSHDALYFLLAWFHPGNRGIAAEANGSTIVMLSVSDMRIDPRIEREARALAQVGFEVVVIWPSVSRSDDSVGGIDWGPGITFKRLPYAAGEFVRRFPGYCGREMLLAALQFKPLAFHGHDLTSGLIALTAAKKTGAHAVVDFHEWFSENVGWREMQKVWRPHGFPQKLAYQWLEQQVFRHASEIVTVCDSIADEMSTQYSEGRRKVPVVRNIPDLARQPTRAYPDIRDELNLPKETFVVLWQGGVGLTRMIEPIIDALARLSDWVFVIRGPGLEDYAESYRKRAEAVGQSSRLFFMPLVPSRDVVAAAMSADAGIWTLPNLCKNFYYALPNKIFEYLAAGLPVLAADFPEARRLIEENRVGQCFDPYDPGSIADAIARFSRDRAALAACKARIPELMASVSAQDEWQKIVGIYRNLQRREQFLGSPRVAGIQG